MLCPLVNFENTDYIKATQLQTFLYNQGIFKGHKMNSCQSIVSRNAVFSLLMLCSNSSFTNSPTKVGNVVNLIKEKKKSYKDQEDFFTPLGNHIIAELTGCTNLNNSAMLESVLHEAAVSTGATVLSVTVHEFEPFGMTGVAVLQESHISVHTWPEYGYASLDIYTCGVHIHIEEALKVLKKFFQPKKIQALSVLRGFEKKEYDASEIDEQYRLKP